MAYKVLVVDDSSFFRRRVTDIINSDENLTVIDVAVNGIEAVEKAKSLKPDVITMDIEMPLLNGIEAVKQIMANSPIPILMFSSLTHQGAKATLDALDAGALDFLPKKFNEIANANSDAGSILRSRVLEIARKRLSARRVGTRPLTRTPLTKPSTTSASNSAGNTLVKRPVANIRPSGKSYKLLAIGTSTGGPVALQKILTQLPQNFPLPIIMVQHMPAAFTKAFAMRLDSLCKISVREAENGDVLKPGVAYLAPGGTQMLIEGKENHAKLKVVVDDTDRIAFKPSVDVSFGSAAKVFSGSVLGIILTGMGSDGREGSRMLKAKGATIWAQDEESCVVYGMPQAVAKAGISTADLPLLEFPNAILKEIQYG
ncbi:chemotaxis response regulator protein-glutamate methylesterase [Thalassotalea sp. 1_MG-2023]|uniref:protein-glutamate methylesterase/protein-glutamine glutaminase n=1 Tax=Thalassotalea sp. 1_MG-2023 TaxID=3062680 RepID=UPI0026E3599E|nr:chemotaxis response regulator protein-glutamate methylesterase [Thalassotalea sp. 1_MG-2023]MDO6426485.1 chemotaxis response regulator protein-glutamate methylesterase [Thalassotalea sp. 1_MG-2023]